MQYQEVLRKVYGGDFSTIPDRLLCLDPGETTGWCLFEKGVLTRCGQEETVGLDPRPGVKEGKKKLMWERLENLFNDTLPTHVVCENYRIYAHKLDRHSFSEVETLRLIGGIDMVCNIGWMERERPEDIIAPGTSGELQKYHLPVPLYYTMAAQAKGFVTDNMLKTWDFWKPGMRHSRDAIRHGIYFLIITNRPKGEKINGKDN